MKIIKSTISKIVFSIFLIYFLNACQDGNLDNLEEEISLGALDIVSIDVTAPAAIDNKMPLNETLQFIATGNKSDGSTVDVTELATLTWSISNTNAASISTTGLLSSVAAANVDVSASISTVSGSKNITIADVQTVASIAVTDVSDGSPTTPTTPICSELQLKANGTYIDPSDNLPFLWEVTKKVAWEPSTDISSEGVISVTTNTTDPIPVTATLDGQTGSANVDILDDDLESISITPAAPRIVVDSTVQLTAIALRTGGVLDNDITNLATWNPISSGVAIVNETGEVTAVGVGTEQISATCGNISPPVEITVSVEATNQLKRIEVYEKAKTNTTTVVDKYIEMTVGQTKELKVDAFYANTDTSTPFTSDVEWLDYPLGDSATPLPFTLEKIASTTESKGRVTADRIGIAGVRVEYFDSSLTVALQDIFVIRVIP